MNELTLLRRIGVRLGVVIAALIVFSAGLFLMNTRADWALAAGAFLCIATPVVAGVRLWALLTENSTR